MCNLKKKLYFCFIVRLKWEMYCRLEKERLKIKSFKILQRLGNLWSIVKITIDMSFCLLQFLLKTSFLHFLRCIHFLLVLGGLICSSNFQYIEIRKAIACLNARFAYHVDMHKKTWSYTYTSGGRMSPTTWLSKK